MPNPKSQLKKSRPVRKIKIAMRMCAACRARHPKQEMVRIAVDGEGKIKVDAEGKLRGRGVNLCSRVECLEKALEITALGRVWPGVQSSADVNEIRQDFEGLLTQRKFRAGKQNITYRVTKIEAETHIGHAVTRAI